MSLDTHPVVSTLAGRRARRRAAVLELVLAGGLAIAGSAAAQDPDAGRQVWANGGCGSCHGPQGQGGISRDFPTGPSLRTSLLDRDGLIEATACGRPGTTMAAWLKGAYTESGCFGADPGPPPAGAMVIGAFSIGEIEALVDYIMVEFIRN